MSCTRYLHHVGKFTVDRTTTSAACQNTLNKTPENPTIFALIDSIMTKVLTCDLYII